MGNRKQGYGNELAARRPPGQQARAVLYHLQPDLINVTRAPDIYHRGRRRLSIVFGLFNAGALRAPQRVLLFPWPVFPAAILPPLPARTATNSLWLLAATALAVPLAGIVIARALAARQLRRDARQLFAAADNGPARVYHEAQLAGLPAPVQRYFRHVLPAGQPYLRGLRLRHGGQFKTDFKQDWVPIRGEQYITANPAGFIWQGTTRQFTARDEYVAGRGGLTVRLFGAVPIVRGHGPHFDQGELLRWLAEAAWLPTALLPGRHIAWTAVDDHSARLRLTHAGQAVACLVRFNERNEIAACEASRYITDTEMLPWQGRFSQYRRHQGMLVPFAGEASWVVDGQRRPYAQFVVQELDYEALRPF